MASTAKQEPMLVKLADKDYASAGVLLDTQYFQLQSYFDNSLLQQAIVVQPVGTLIIQEKDSQYQGKALTNSPDSQCPIAVTAKLAGKGKGGSIATFILAPGQSVAPFDGSPFRSFSWGLPFGWLGGGLATVLVSQQHEFGGYSAKTEVMFHRARFAIQQPSALTSSGYNDSPLNWPIRFPWVQAMNLSGVSQAGSPNLVVQPTRCKLVLRGVSSLGAPANMRAIIQGSNDFDADSGGTLGSLTQTNPAFEELTWPQFVSIGTSGNLATQNAVLDLFADTSSLVRLGCDGVASSPSATPTAVGVTFVDDSGSGALAGCYVDVIRYGTI